MNEQVQKIIKHPAALPTGVGLLSFGVGVGLGFLIGRKTKKHPKGDLHVLPHVDLDLKVEDIPTKELDNFIVKTEEEAVLVINAMNEVIERDGFISVGEFNQLLGRDFGEPEEGEWGWTYLDYGMVEKVKKGYMLVLPNPKAVGEDDVDGDGEDEDSNALDDAAAVGREFVKNRFGLPDLTVIEEVADEAEDEESEAEEDAPEEEGSSDEQQSASEEGVREANAFATGGDTWNLLKELRGRTESAPYVIHKDEFYADEKGYRQHSLTYYAGDNIMLGDDEKIVYNHDTVVGELKWGHGSGSPIMFYVRNDKYRAEYEVTHVDGFFQVEVMGMDVEDNDRVRNLEHSGEPRRFRDRTE